MAQTTGRTQGIHLMNASIHRVGLAVATLAAAGTAPPEVVYVRPAPSPMVIHVTQTAPPAPPHVVHITVAGTGGENDGGGDGENDGGGG
jgi:hypothetical protein